MIFWIDVMLYGESVVDIYKIEINPNLRFAWMNLRRLKIWNNENRVVKFEIVVEKNWEC